MSRKIQVDKMCTDFLHWAVEPTLPGMVLGASGTAVGLLPLVNPMGWGRLRAQRGIVGWGLRGN